MTPDKGLRQAAYILLALAVSGCTWLIWHVMDNVDSTLRDLLVKTRSLNRKENKTVTEYISTWTDAEGVEHKVKTVRAPGESPEQHAARHQADVEALKAIYPPAG